MTLEPDPPFRERASTAWLDVMEVGQGTARSQVRYGVIGTGMMGVEHIENILHLDGADVTAIADPHPESRAWARAGLRAIPRICNPKATFDSTVFHG